MNDVKRYRFKGAAGEYVYAADYDHVVARNTFRDLDAGRYRKLQLWMASNVKEGWAEVEKMGGICAWMSCRDMDEYLDRLPDCNVGLCEKRKEES